MIWEFPLEHQVLYGKPQKNINTMSTRAANGCKHWWHVVPVDLVPIRATPPAKPTCCNTQMRWPLLKCHRIVKKRNLLLHMVLSPLPSWITVPDGTVEAMNGTREQHPCIYIYIIYGGFLQYVNPKQFVFPLKIAKEPILHDFGSAPI